ncbi:hypothetical protein C8Q78DRAFT_1077971 [Trametes maxima]|nr:hypothetical protein C8Q78DRAFT_1077971 [Trametes maxima]
MAIYRSCNTPAEREKFAKQYATRWSELSRLPYFDLCAMVVVNPMHNLFLGLVKTHFYHIWVQLKILRKTQELQRFHALLKNLSLPSKLGRLPKLIGEPAGGSLTADEWLILATVVGPLVMPELWINCTPDPDGSRLAARREQIAAILANKKSRNKLRQSGRRNGRQRRKRGTAGHTQTPIPSSVEQPQATALLRRSSRQVKLTEKAREMVLEPDDDGAIEVNDTEVWNSDDELSDESEDGLDTGPTTSGVHPRDLANFHKLCLALKHLLSQDLTPDDTVKGDALLREYCLELIELYGPGVIRPNHHYSTHTGPSALNYGPLREFWTFIFKRMNKILKSYKTGNHGGGEIEATFMREFHRTAELYGLLRQGLQNPPFERMRDACAQMVRTTSDNRGTLQQLAQDLDDVHADDDIDLQLSPRAVNDVIPYDTYWALLASLRLLNPTQAYHSVITVPDSGATSIPVPNMVMFFDYAIVKGQRYLAAHRSKTSCDSLVLIRIANSGETWVGEVQDIFRYQAPGIPATVNAYIKWFHRLPASLFRNSPWSTFIEPFGLDFWVADRFQQENEPGPANSIVSLNDFVTPVARHRTTWNGVVSWITLPLHS